MTQVATREDWKRVQPGLSKRVGAEEFDLFFKNTVILQLDPELVDIGVGSAMMAEFLKDSYESAVAQCIEDALGYRPQKIKFSINGHLFRKMRQNQAGAGDTHDLAVDGDPASADAKTKARPGEATDRVQAPNRIFHLNEKFSLDNFIVGPNNKLAFNAAVDLADAKSPDRFPALFIYGTTGTGKTHLLQGIALQLEQKRPQMRTLYVTGEYFCNQYFAAAKSKSYDAFHQRFRNVDLLIIDDVQFIATKVKCQDQLLYTLKALESLGKRVVLAAPVHPKELDGISDVLVSRFVQGMIAELKIPGPGTRVAIIKNKLGIHRARFPEATIQLLAGRLDCSVRELEGHLTQLVHVASMNEIPRITVPLVEQVLRSLLDGKIRLVELGDIENVVIAHYCVTSDQIHGSSRQRTVAMARQVCMYLARRLTAHSLKEIGRYFGNKNHTTVVFAAQKVEKLIASKPEVKGTIERLERQLHDR